MGASGSSHPTKDTSSGPRCASCGNSPSTRRTGRRWGACQHRWSCKGLLSLMDAVEAIELCWTLCQLGHELDVKEYIGWWKQLFRARPGKIEQLKAHWTDAGWRLALAMGQGHQFDHAMQGIIDDTAAVQAALMKEMGAPKAPPKKPPSRPYQPKGKGYGRADRQDSTTWTSSQSSQEEGVATVEVPRRMAGTAVEEVLGRQDFGLGTARGSP